MGIIASLLLAATLSSDEIGNFFDLPAWMPDEVSSVNTPGSDPAAGGGWYIDEYTNGVVLANTWVCSVDGEEFSQTEVIYRSGELWFLPPVTRGALAFKHPGWTINVPITWYDDAGEDAENITYTTTEECFDVSNEQHYVTMSIECVRNKTNGLIRTGRKVPRSPRLTPEVASGVNSTFEGYFERQYFASQAQSNVWDTALWGPRTDLKRFWFDPYWMRGETRGEYGGWDYSTNRTITTRRLLEYDKIASLASHLRWYGIHYFDMMLFGPTRPGWIESQPYVGPYGRCWWGTTDDTVLDGTEIVPTLDWVSNPFPSNSWAKCSQGLFCLDEDAVWDFQSAINRRAPTEILMNSMSFGQPGDRGEWEIKDSWPSTIDGVTMGHLIETNFPHADGWAITNATRRLFSDRLCCMNQMLGLMDRTYHVPTITYPAHTNRYAQNRMMAGGTASATLTYDSSIGEFSVSALGAIDWQTVTSDERVWGSTNQWADGNALHYRLTATSTGAEVGVSGSLSFGGLSDEAVAEILTQLGVERSGDEYSITIWPYDPPICFYVSVADRETGETARSGWVAVDFPSSTNVNLDVGLAYKRVYLYGEPIGDLALGPTQPGWQSSGRVSSCAYGAVAGAHWRENISVGMSMIPWVYDNSQVEYKSYTGSYASRNGLALALGSIVTNSYLRFVGRCAADPTQPSLYAPISVSDFNRVKNSVALSNGALVVCPLSIVTYADGYWNETTFTSTEVYHVDFVHEGEAVTNYPSATFVLTVSADETHYSPSQVEHDPRAEDVKAGLITRTDWSWKTLKRTDD